MCGRFTLTSSPEEVARRFAVDPSELAPDGEEPELAPRYNVAPGQDVLVVRQPAEAARRTLERRRWGLVPPWAEDPRLGSRLVNARSESVAEKPAYRRAFRFRRCLIPADGFYEWSAASRAPYHLAPIEPGPVGFAGLFEHWRGAEGETLDSCVILTTAANALLQPLHDRMPVVLAPEHYALWLDPEVREPELLRPLLRPAPAEAWQLQRVSRRVNDVRCDEPGLLDPVPDEVEPTQLGLDL